MQHTSVQHRWKLCEQDSRTPADAGPAHVDIHKSALALEEERNVTRDASSSVACLPWAVSILATLGYVGGARTRCLCCDGTLELSDHNGSNGLRVHDDHESF